MKSLFHILIAFMAASAGFAANFPEGSPPFLDDYGKAIAKAKASGKPAVIVFSAVWCPPCQIMKNEVYPSKEVRPLHDKFVWAYLDFDKPANRPLIARYKVESIPQIFFFTPGGEPFAALDTVVSPGGFASILKKVLASPAVAGKPAGEK